VSAGLLVGVLALPALAQDSPNVLMPPNGSVPTPDHWQPELKAGQGSSSFPVFSLGGQTADSTIFPYSLPAAVSPAAVEEPACGDFTGRTGGDGDRFKGLPSPAILSRFGWFVMPPFAAAKPHDRPGYYTLCNQLNGKLLPDVPKYPYPRFSLMFATFYDADWRYLDDPNNTEHDYFDFLKRIRFGPDDLFMFTTGGEFRVRYESRENSGLSNLTMGRNNTDDLFRVRVYNDLWITQYVRIYSEFFSATSPDNRLAPALPDRDPADFMDLFVDLRTIDLDDKPVWLRMGRQELLYGSGRLVSTLDWSNTRRTFQGIKAFWQSDNLDIDAFVVNPVVPAGTYAGGSQDGFTAPDTQTTFAGLWTTYKFRPGNDIDLYYLMLQNDRPVSTAPTGSPGVELFNTIGSRWVGDYHNWLWDFEGMSQFGQFAAQRQLAWSATASAGYVFNNAPLTPCVWLVYDFASGSKDVSSTALPPGFTGPAGPHTFNQLFPFNHYYDWMDLVGRQNIQDFRTITTIYPADWMFVWLQTHCFYLDSATDYLYNSAGAGIRRDPTGRSGRDVGTEFDIIPNIHIDNHQDILFSYSYLVAGRFLRDTATTPAGKKDPQFLCVQYSVRW
jgi:Alginate export